MGGKHKAVAGEIISVRGPWTDALLICRKCSKKLVGGFGQDRDETLAGMVKDVLRERGLRRRYRVIQVGCLDVCPRNGVVVIRGSTPGEMLIVPEGLDRQLVAERLLDPALTPATAAGS